MIANDKSEPLLLTAAQAAKVLAISPRTLWTLTDTGVVPCVRLGRSVRYSTDDLREVIRKNRRGTNC